MEKASEAPDFPMERTTPFDPPEQYRRFRAESPVKRVRIWDGSNPWLITKYEDQRVILADARFSANSDRPGFPIQSEAYRKARSVFGRNFITMDGAEHDVYRRMLNKEFSAKRAREMEPHIQQIVDELIDRMLAAGPPAEIMQDFALPVPLRTICHMLGVPYEDHEFFHKSAETIMTSASLDDVSTAAKELLNYFQRLLEERRRAPREDVVSRLVEYLERGDINERELSSTCVLLLTAGHETTANQIALGTLALLEHPAELQRLRDNIDDPDFVAGAVEELLRYLNVTHAGRRRMAMEDVEIGGQLIKAGEGVILANDSGNRDEEILDNPDQLILDRGFRRHLAFGFGQHQCSGQHLARVELQVAYRTLFRRIAELRVAVPTEALQFRHGSTVWGVRELPVVW